MRFIIPAAIVGITVAAAVRAETDYSGLIAEAGLSGAEATLSAITEPTPSDQFALGGVRFLGAVEGALQQIARTDLDHEMVQRSGLPFLRIPVQEVATPDPFRPEIVEEVFLSALNDLEGSLAALDTVGAADPVAVVIDTADLWFDVNANGIREPGEGFFDIAAPQLARALANAGSEADFAPPVIRFDTADAAWLSAYAHLLSGVSETVLAFDPTTAITRVTDSARDLEEFNRGLPKRFLGPDDERWLDLLAMVILAIEGQPDTMRSRAALSHFQSMISDNHAFWARVEAETDNDREWIPNPRQQTALPIDFPPGIGRDWRMVLAEAEAVLTGDLLIPHWRLGPGAGFDLAEAMTNPPHIDLIGLIQGETIVPYAKEGPRMTGESLRRFDAMLGGDAALYMVILN